MAGVIVAGVIVAAPLTAEAFRPFGDVIEARGTSFPINAGLCDRFHDLARLEFAGPGGRAAVSIGRSRPVTLPHRVDLVERHPLGSQAFVPLSADPFLVVVAAKEGGTPGPPRAFVTQPGQGVNYLRGTWHGVLTPLGREADFLIVDRVGDGINLEEHAYPEPYEIVLPSKD
ncbi:MAG: ureidoglycolate lyase [Pseudomonadota bacterium]